MKKRFSIIILFLLPFFYGCFAHDMGLIIGKTAAFPLTVTIEVVDGVLTGFFGTSIDEEKSKSTCAVYHRVATDYLCHHCRCVGIMGNVHLEGT